MIKFNELKISDCDKTLIIDIQVPDLPYYTNVFIDKITIDTQDTYIGSGPSTTPVYTQTVTGSVKTFRIELPESVLETVKLDRNLFFVYAVAKGIPAPDTPCGMDNINSIGVVTNFKPIYDKALSLLTQSMDKCAPSQPLMDFVYKLNGLNLAIKLCNYPLAIKYYDKFFKTDYYFDLLTSNCGCR